MQTKRDAVKDLTRNMPALAQVNIGKAFDRGARLGYSEGFKDANEFGSKTFIACTFLALHQVFGFGQQRLERLYPVIMEHLLDTLSAVQAVEKLYQETGVKLDAPDYLSE